MFCTHITEGYEEAVKEQFPDLLCKSCVNRMAEGEENMPQYELKNFLPKEVSTGCNNCILSKLARSV